MDVSRLVELQEGSGADVRRYIDVDELLQIWDEMYLPVGVESEWADYFERVLGTQVRRRWASTLSKSM